MITPSKNQTEEIANLVRKTELKHIAIIMDGNRRWAKKRFLPTPAGHNEGVKSLKKVVKACGEFGIKYLTVYAFSTENWGRKQDEVDFLMKLLAETIKKETKDLHANNVKIKIIGNIAALSKDLQAILNESMDYTSQNTGLNLQIAINYGSRDEIISAVKNIAEEVKLGNIDTDSINQELISSYLYTSEIPDPDLLIRTGGDFRISNYLLWQAAYAEILVIDTLWPDFDKEILADAIINFSNRDRRFGKG
ncbi:MAG: isoprenyl transferase [bacterium]